MRVWQLFYMYTFKEENSFLLGEKIYFPSFSKGYKNVEMSAIKNLEFGF